MKRIFFHIFFLFCTTLCWGQVSILSVTDEDKHKTKEDFYHTFEYFIKPAGGGQQNKCQATRIGRRWFATAAHCVAQTCQKGCTIQMDLLERPVSALASVTHTPKKPAVFVHPEYSSKVFVKNDFALIRLDLDRTSLAYYRHATKKQPYNRALTAQQFAAYLERNRKVKSQFTHIKSPELPPLVLFDNFNAIIDRKISVISIFGGVRKIEPDPYVVHYVKALGFAYTKNFGIRKGMSGSGVMTNTGELIGIVSGNMTSAHWEKKKGGEKVSAVEELFMFPVFNADVAAFMEQVMGSDYYKLTWKDAYPSFVYKSRRNYASVIESVNYINKQKSK